MQVRQDGANAIGTECAQNASPAVRDVAEARGRLDHSATRLLSDIADAVERARDRGNRHLNRVRDILNRYRHQGSLEDSDFMDDRPSGMRCKRFLSGSTYGQYRVRTAADAPVIKRLQISSSPNGSAKDDRAAGRRSRAVRLALDLLTASW